MIAHQLMQDLRGSTSGQYSYIWTHRILAVRRTLKLRLADADGSLLGVTSRNGKNRTLRPIEPARKDGRGSIARFVCRITLRDRRTSVSTSTQRLCDSVSRCPANAELFCGSKKLPYSLIRINVSACYLAVRRSVRARPRQCGRSSRRKPNVRSAVRLFCFLTRNGFSTDPAAPTT